MPHIATLPFKVLQQMVHHPLTDKGIAQFKADWARAPRPRQRELRTRAKSRDPATADRAPSVGRLIHRVASTTDLYSPLLQSSVRSQSRKPVSWPDSGFPIRALLGSFAAAAVRSSAA